MVSLIKIHDNNLLLQSVRLLRLSEAASATKKILYKAIVSNISIQNEITKIIALSTLQYPPLSLSLTLYLSFAIILMDFFCE